MSHGFDSQVRDQRDATLMHVAASNQSIEILKLAHELGLDPNATDQNGNTPLHYVSYNSSSIASSCIDFLVHVGAKVNLSNQKHETPLLISIKSDAKSNVISLIQSGAVLPNPKKIQRLIMTTDYNRLSMLFSNEVVFASQNPTAMAMRLSGMLRQLARLNPTQALKYRSLGDEMEDMALTMLNLNLVAATNHTQQVPVTDELLFTALDNNQKKVIHCVFLHNPLNMNITFHR